MTENNSPKITRSTLGSSGNAPKMTKVQESFNAPSRQFNGSQNAPTPVTTTKATQVSSKINANSN